MSQSSTGTTDAPTEYVLPDWSLQITWKQIKQDERETKKKRDRTLEGDLKEKLILKNHKERFPHV